MIYKFKCKKCGATKEIRCSVNELNTLNVNCDVCNTPMTRNYTHVVIDNKLLDDDMFNLNNNLRKNNVLDKQVVF